MRSSRGSLRNRNRLPQPSGGQDSTKPLDTWLTRAANLSQPLVLALALFGYFYTVLPVYQKEVLSEQIAAKELELAKLQREIDATEPAMMNLRAKASKLQRQIHELTAQTQYATTVNDSLRKRQFALTSQNTLLASEVASKSADALRVEAAGQEAALRTYHDSFSASVSLQYVMPFVNGYDLVKSPSYESIVRYLLAPYDAISATLSDGDSKFMPSLSSIPRPIKDAYHRHLRMVIDSGKDSLSRPQSDVNSLLFQIKSEMALASVDQTPGDHFNEKQYETTKRLVQILQASHKREWDRTNNFMDQLDLRLIRVVEPTKGAVNQ